jgi:predicted amidohydrolase
MARLTVAAVSPEIRIGDVDGNLDSAADAIRSATARGAGLIVLPELATSGYALADRAEASRAALTRDDPRWAVLHEALIGDAVVVIGYAEAADGVVHNTAAALARDRRLYDYRKSHLWGAERMLFAAGHEAGAVVEAPFGMLGLAICYDDEFPEVPRRLALAGADVLALPVAWPLVPRPAGEHPPETIQAMGSARSSRLPIVVADQRGANRGVVWTGGTAIVDGDGWIAAEDERFAIAELDLAAVRDKSLPQYNDLFADRREDLY